MPSRWLPCRIAAVCLGLATIVALNGCTKQSLTDDTTASPAPKRLTILTPHNAKIQEAIELGFSDWYMARQKTPVVIDWINRGTPQCIQYVEKIFTGNPDATQQKNPDIVFGGGVADHQILASNEWTRQLEIEDALQTVPNEVGGLPTRDPAGRWFTTDLSSFGIVVNAEACSQRGIEPPATWTDLADKRFFSWIGVADPAGSGSHTQCMMLILQKQGWEQGWATIIRILANTRALSAGSTDVIHEIRSGVLLAGFVVSFDGLAAMDTTDGQIKYISPAGATAITPGVVSVLRSARDATLAEDFVRYCLSKEGQIIWGVRADQRDSLGETLYHYPVVPSIYEEFAGKLAVKDNPFNVDLGIKVDLDKSRTELAILPAIVDAACGENHVLLQKAWEAVIKSGMNPDALAELTALPFDADTADKISNEILSGNDADGTVAKLPGLFHQKYKRVIELAGGGS